MHVFMRVMLAPPWLKPTLVWEDLQASPFCRDVAYLTGLLNSGGPTQCGSQDMDARVTLVVAVLSCQLRM